MGSKRTRRWAQSGQECLGWAGGMQQCGKSWFRVARGRTRFRFSSWKAPKASTHLQVPRICSHRKGKPQAVQGLGLQQTRGCWGPRESPSVSVDPKPAAWAESPVACPGEGVPECDDVRGHTLAGRPGGVVYWLLLITHSLRTPSAVLTGTEVHRWYTLFSPSRHSLSAGKTDSQEDNITA